MAKLILSRKGFDSSTGRVPSPILTDGTLVPLPIPSRSSPIPYEDISVHGHDLGPLVEQLTRGRMDRTFGAHLDPDLDRPSYRRAEGWRALFGQANSAQGVLRNQGVGPGDLFLYFGWFRQAEDRNGKLGYVPGAEDLHVLFGWLQVERVLTVGEDMIPEWAAYHPHLDGTPRRSNTLYVARENLELEGEAVDAPGAGLFPRMRPELRLTAPDESRSIWKLPEWFFPVRSRPPLSAHESPMRWYRRHGETFLESVPRGQEFVLDLDHYPEAFAWLRSLLAE